MDKKIKILLIFLGVFSLSAVGISGWIYLSSRAEVAEYAEKQAGLERQSSYFQERLDSSQKETRRWQEKSESITTALNKLGKEHVILQRQYTKEKDSLIQSTKALSAQLEELDKLYVQAKEKAELNTSDKFLASLLKEKAQLEVEVEKLRNEISSQGELTRLKEEKEKLKAELSNTQKVSGLLSNDLLQEKKKRAALEQDLANVQSSLKDIEEEKGKIAGQLAKMKQDIEDLKQRPDEFASIELSPIIVKADPSVIAREPHRGEQILPAGKADRLEGRIITVNERHGFVVIDIGRDEGVEQAMTFNVYRQGEKVGKIKVIERRKAISACNIKEMAFGGFNAGDTVRR